MNRPSVNTALARVVYTLVFGLVASSVGAQEGNIWGPISEAIVWSEKGYRDYFKDGKSQREYFSDAERYSMAQDAANMIERMRETHPAVAEQGKGRYQQDMERLRQTTDRIGKKLDGLGIPRPAPTPASPQPRPAQPAPPPRGPSFESFNRDVNPLPPNHPAGRPAAGPARTETTPAETGPRDPGTPAAGDARSQNTPSGNSRGTIDTRSSQESKGGAGGTADTRSSQESKGGSRDTTDTRTSQESKGGSNGSVDSRSSQESKGGAGGTVDTRSAQESKGGSNGSVDTRSSQESKGGANGSVDTRSSQESKGGAGGTVDTRSAQESKGGSNGTTDTRSSQESKGGANGSVDTRSSQESNGGARDTTDTRGTRAPGDSGNRGSASDASPAASDVRGAANQGPPSGGTATNSSTRPPAGGEGGAEGSPTRGEPNKPSAASSSAEGERLNRAVSNATAPARENIKDGLSKLNDASTISKVGNTAIDLVEGNKTGSEAAKDIVVAGVDYLTTPPVPGLPGAATTALTLKDKSEDLARGLNAVEKEQAAYDRQRSVEVGKELQKAGVSPQDRLNIMYEMARGNEGPLENKRAELEQKGVQLELPERQIASVEADDTVLERTGNTLYGVGKGIVYDAPKEVLTQAWRTGDRLGTIAREGSEAVDGNAQAEAQRAGQKALNERMSSRFESLGFNRDDVEAAFDSKNGGSPYAWESLQARAAILETCPDLQKLPPEERQAALDALLAQMIAERPEVEQETVVKEIAKTLGPPEETKPPITEPPQPVNPPEAVEGAGGGTEEDFTGTDAGGEVPADDQTPPPGTASLPASGLNTTGFARTQQAEQERDQAPPVTPDTDEAQRLLAVLAQRQAVLDQAEADRRAWLESERESQLQAGRDYQDMLDDYNKKLAQITDYQQRREMYVQQLAAWNEYQRKLKDYKGQVEAWNDYRRQLADYNKRVAQYNDYRQRLLDFNNRVAAWNDYRRRLAEFQEYQQRQWEAAQSSPPHFQPPSSGGGSVGAGSGGGQKSTAVISEAPQ